MEKDEEYVRDGERKLDRVEEKREEMGREEEEDVAGEG
jgi:DNA modification methylase